MLKLLTLVAGLFTTIAGYAAASLSRKAIVVFSVITAFAAVTAAFLVCMKILITGLIAFVAMPTWIASWLGMFIPSNYAGVISLIMSAKTCRAAYDLAVEKVKMIGQST